MSSPLPSAVAVELPSTVAAPFTQEQLTWLLTTFAGGPSAGPTGAAPADSGPTDTVAGEISLG